MFEVVLVPNPSLISRNHQSIYYLLTSRDDKDLKITRCILKGMGWLLLLW